MDILKVFVEEPVALETLTPDADPDARRRQIRAAASGAPPQMPLEALLAPARDARHHRAYLAGTRLAPDGTAARVGLTALADPDAYARPVVEAWGAAWWGRLATDGAAEALDAAAAADVLRAPDGTALLVTAPAPVDAARLRAVTAGPHRYALGALRALLDDDGAVACFPEPAHDGHDWHAFAAAPLRDRLVAALRRHPAADARRFVLPYQKARSESKFYFETWRLAEPTLPAYIEEV